jgi:hypothetical protein
LGEDSDVQRAFAAEAAGKQQIIDYSPGVPYDSGPRPPSSGTDQRHRVPLPDLNSPIPSEALAQLREELTKLQADFAARDGKINYLDEQVARILRELADRPDRSMIERLFEKFKASLAAAMGKFSDRDAGAGNWATKDELKRLEFAISEINRDWEEAAAVRKSTVCLSCGKPYRTCAGSIVDDETKAVLGAAPIAHISGTTEQKPCFVYGSDHELYYSASPRGRTFVAPSSQSRPSNK